MRGLFGFVGSAIYGVIVCYIIWLMFYYLSPWVMQFGWVAVLLYWLFGGGIIYGIMSSIAAVVFVPIMSMTGNASISKVIPTCAILFFAYSSVKLPWGLNLDYSLVKIIIAGSISISALATFLGLLVSLWNTPLNNEE